MALRTPSVSAAGSWRSPPPLGLALIVTRRRAGRRATRHRTAPRHRPPRSTGCSARGPSPTATRSPPPAPPSTTPSTASCTSRPPRRGRRDPARSASGWRPCRRPGRRAPTGTSARMAFPPADSNYHDYAELTAVVNKVVADHPAHRPQDQHRYVVRGPGPDGREDLRQRRHRRERAGDPVQLPAARPRAPDRRDGDLPAEPLHRQLRQRLPDHQHRQQPGDLDRADRQPRRQRVRHRHRLVPLLAQEPAAQQRLDGRSAPT